jgi:hypothetical protein
VFVIRVRGPARRLQPRLNMLNAWRASKASKLLIEIRKESIYEYDPMDRSRPPGVRLHRRGYDELFAYEKFKARSEKKGLTGINRGLNHVPIAIAEITMDPHVSLDQEIPTSYNGFAFVIRGAVTIGEKAELPKTGQVGWLDRPNGEGSSVLHMDADEEGAPRTVCRSASRKPDRLVRTVHRRLEGGYRKALGRVPRRAICANERTPETGRLNPFCERQTGETLRR